jgi:hypothetical protein
MTKTDTIRARIEPKLKAKAEGILSSLGKLIGVSFFWKKELTLIPSSMTVHLRLLCGGMIISLDASRSDRARSPHSSR